MSVHEQLKNVRHQSLRARKRQQAQLQGGAENLREAEQDIDGRAEQMSEGKSEAYRRLAHSALREVTAEAQDNRQAIESELRRLQDKMKPIAFRSRKAR